MALLHPRSFFQGILSRFPAVDFAVGYGSGVFKQSNYGSAKPTVDMIFGVADSCAWHRQNLLTHPGHYAQPLRSLGASAVTWVQETGGAKVYYHPFVDIGDGQQLKYGVVSTAHLKEDLRDWRALFCAGRLHKPALILKSSDSLRSLQQLNLQSAMLISLLQLPERFSPMDLFLKIAGLSYGGDPRFDFGAENSNKVSNIVEANIGGFGDLYAEPFADCPWVHCTQGSLEAMCETMDSAKAKTLVNQVRTPEDAIEIVSKLPAAISESFDDERTISLFGQNALGAAVLSSTSSIVRKCAPAQYAKGIMTAGVLKSLIYVKQKLRKGASKS